MANKPSNPSLINEATPIVDGVATLSVTSPIATVGNQSSNDKSADSALSSAQETKIPDSTSLIQLPPSRPLWNTPEGRIAGYKRAIEKNDSPDDHANLEALIRYYEDGGKVPEGDEEVWAIDGQVSFGIRKYTRFDQMPEGFLQKRKYCDVSSFCLCRYWSRRSLISFSFVLLLTSCFSKSSKFYQLNSVPSSDEHLIADKEGRVIL
jgi:hypothetical protein